MHALLLTAVMPLAAPAAADVLPSADRRFAAATGDEAPSFQRHVIPLMGRLGCNGRACHGSFQGQGGFRLSLFGYDFQTDHDALVKGSTPRVDLKTPSDSTALLKPTRAVAHKGGKRMEKDGWEYNIISRWIKAGAPGVKSGASFAALEVEPREIVFAKPAQSATLKLIARWSDGSREDVTPLCRFRSNDESVATVDASGKVIAAGKGDTHIVAFYDNGVVPVPVMLAVSDRVGSRYPRVPTPTKVDELVVAQWQKLGLVPSEPCNDAEFLRRVSLDLTGTLPTADEVSSFLANRAADKLPAKVEELLRRPAYAAWWTTRLCDITGNSERNGPLGGEQALNREKSKQWYDWVHRRVRANVGYDKLVEGIVLAVGRSPSVSYDDYCKEMSSYFRRDKPTDFSARETMPYFWTRRSVGSSEGKALSFAYAFLGVSLQCAQCHKHPYDQWTKQDFESFTAFFDGVRQRNAPRDAMQEMKKGTGLVGLDEDSGQYKRIFVSLLSQGKVLPFKEVSVPPARPRSAKAPKGKVVAGRVITPRLLGGEEVIARDYDDPRRPVMDWLRDKDNPYFARALVNRVWSAYFHRGLIDPADDLNLANPPTNAALLDHLSHGFVKSGFDLKWLHREIVNSRTYQLGWRPNDTNGLDERHFSRSVLRRLPAEVVVDAITMATASDAARRDLDADPASTRSIGVASCYAGGPRNKSAYGVTLFGKPPRVINCDCERSVEPSLLQTVYLRNDDEVLKLLDRADGWLRQVSREKGQEVEKLIRQAYLRTLSRPPEDRELALALKHVNEAKDTAAGLRDLLWALLNTKEFLVNR